MTPLACAHLHREAGQSCRAQHVHIKPILLIVNGDSDASDERQHNSIDLFVHQSQGLDSRLESRSTFARA